MVTSSWILHLLPIFLLQLPVATIGDATFNITNRCPHTVWPAAMPVGGGRKLEPGESWTLNMPAGTTGGRVWARTGCSFDGAGRGKCETGDCRGVLACTDYGQQPNTIAEFTLAQFGGTPDYFDISLVDGFNVPMDFLPVPNNGRGGHGCTRGPRCAANITSQCPSDLKAPGGCSSPCNVLKPQDKYCCTGNATNNCEPTTYSVFFVRMCPDAYSYSRDDTASTMFTCPSGTNYQVIFCPSNISASSPATDPPTPVVATRSSTRIRVSSALLTLVSIASFILVVFIAFFAYKLRERLRRKMEEGDEAFETPGMPTRFTFQQLQEATNQFRDKLGEGGFGSVFEGQYGEERIAVKHLDRAGQDKSHRRLVYEYMPKGSLDRWIYYSHDNDVPSLDWKTRRKVITHIAKGLSYLHEECMKRIAHLDVKPQNILLDENFNAKLSDFGLCKLIDRDKSQVITRMRGTPGYLAPEWLTSQITEKADVYSFGVVVMEIIGGRRNLDTSRSEESIHLITLLEEKVKSDELEDLIDKHSSDMQVHKQEVMEMMKLAMWCLQIDCKRRPRMSEVIKVLEGHMNTATKIDYNFVATSQTMLGIAKNTGSSDPPQALDLSGPR